MQEKYEWGWAPTFRMLAPVISLLLLLLQKTYYKPLAANITNVRWRCYVEFHLSFQ